MKHALELFAGRGQLTFWYRRMFDSVVRVDADREGEPDHKMTATEYLRTRFLEDGPFDLIDFDDEGNPLGRFIAHVLGLSGHPSPKDALARMPATPAPSPR